LAHFVSARKKKWNFVDQWFNEAVNIQAYTGSNGRRLVKINWREYGRKESRHNCDTILLFSRIDWRKSEEASVATAYSQLQILIWQLPNTGTLQLTFSVNINDISITTSILLSYSTFTVYQKANICYRNKYAVASWLFSFIGMGALKILNQLKTDQVQVTLQRYYASLSFSTSKPRPPPPAAQVQNFSRLSCLGSPFLTTGQVCFVSVHLNYILEYKY
jgi:hypothetical protein